MLSLMTQRSSRVWRGSIAVCRNQNSYLVRQAPAGFPQAEASFSAAAKMAGFASSEVASGDLDALYQCSDVSVLRLWLLRKE